MVAVASLDVAANAHGVERLRASDGVELVVERFGNPDSPSLVFAHGFGQTRNAWSLTAATLAKNGWHTITADARGHGDSDWRDDGAYEFPQFVDDLVAVSRLPARRPILVGASMGGLLGLIAQAEHRPFRALILVDITPRWETTGIERIIAFMGAHPGGFASIDEASDAVADYLPHRAEKKSPERLQQLLVRGDDGRLRWHWDSRMLDRIAAKGQQHQAALLDAARRIDVPTLLISGERSDIVSDSTIAEFLQLVPHAGHVRVPRATHMVVGDANDAFTNAVLKFAETFGNSKT